MNHRLSQFEIVDWELVCIPSVLIITPVGIDRAEHTIVYCHCQFVFECMTGQGCVVHFNIHLEILFQAMSLQETDNCFGIHIVLVLGRFHRFRFNEESTGESLCTGIVTSDGQHLSQMFLFTLLVSIEQAHVTFTTAPEHIVSTA